MRNVLAEKEIHSNNAKNNNYNKNHSSALTEKESTRNKAQVQNEWF